MSETYGKFLSDSQDDAAPIVVPVAAMPDVMIDLETMSTRPDAAIVSIGAVAFDMRKCVVGERFYRNVDLRSSAAAGGRIDPDTVLWWVRQSDAARSVLQRNLSTLPDALDALTAFLASCAPLAAIRPWGNGVDFDMGILASAYRATGREIPWKYWNQRDARTLFAMYPSVERDPIAKVAHNALDDAEAQAMHVLKIRESIVARRSKS